MNLHSVGTCSTCGKQSYPSRREARTAKRSLYPQEKMSVYQCGSYFHMGHNEQWRLRPAHQWAPLSIAARIQINWMAKMSFQNGEKK